MPPPDNNRSNKNRANTDRIAPSPSSETNTKKITLSSWTKVRSYHGNEKDAWAFYVMGELARKFKNFSVKATYTSWLLGQLNVIKSQLENSNYSKPKIALIFTKRNRFNWNDDDAIMGIEAEALTQLNVDTQKEAEGRNREYEKQRRDKDAEDAARVRENKEKESQKRQIQMDAASNQMKNFLQKERIKSAKFLITYDRNSIFTFQQIYLEKLEWYEYGRTWRSADNVHLDYCLAEAIRLGSYTYPWDMSEVPESAGVLTEDLPDDCDEAMDVGKCYNIKRQKIYSDAIRAGGNVATLIAQHAFPVLFQVLGDSGPVDPTTASIPPSSLGGRIPVSTPTSGQATKPTTGSGSATQNLRATGNPGKGNPGTGRGSPPPPSPPKPGGGPANATRSRRTEPQRETAHLPPIVSKRRTTNNKEIKYNVKGFQDDFDSLKGQSVYVIKNSQGDVLYVGKGDVLARLDDHMRQKEGKKGKYNKPWYEFDTIEVHGSDLLDREALALEQELIQTLNPKLNKDLEPYTKELRTPFNPYDIPRGDRVWVRRFEITVE